jgi:membrane protease YdiL (CAAX protease family)
MSKQAAFWELFLAYGVIEVTLWAPRPAQLYWWWASVAVIVALTLLHRRPLDEMGVGRKDLGPALVAIPIGAGVAALVLLWGWWNGSLQPLFGPTPVYQHVLGYSVWALAQQFILLSVFYHRVEVLLGDGGKAAAVTAVLFSAAHIPNPLLVPVTLVGGLACCELFRRRRNLYPLAAAHALIGLALAASVPDSIQRHMRVGLGYLTYR